MINIFRKICNFFKNLGKILYKTSFPDKKNILPFIVFISSIIPFLYMPICGKKSLIVTDYSIIYVLIWLYLPGIIIFVHSLLAKSNILCISGSKAGIQSLNYNLILSIILLAVAVTHSTLNLDNIGDRYSNMQKFLIDAPFIILYFMNILLFDKNFLNEYTKEYNGIGYLMLHTAGITIPLKEIVLFTVLFLGGSINPFNPEQTSIIFTILKTICCLILFKAISSNIPKLRTDQIVELFTGNILIGILLWLIAKACFI